MEPSLLIGMLLVVAVILLIAELNERYQGKKICKCRHPRREHSTLLECRHRELIGGFWFHCPCTDYRKASKEPVA